MALLVKGFFWYTSFLGSFISGGGSNNGEKDINGQTYDYIIVGGGLTGLAVANRLSEDSSKTVLVIENGYIVDDASTQVPTFANSINKPLMYDIQSAVDTGLGKSFPVYVGNVVGGGSVVNGMAFNRADAADYDAWEQLGNPGWSFNGLLPYFKKSTTFTPPLASNVKDFGITYDASYYGTNGPVQASYPNFEYPDTKTIWQAFRGAGVATPKEGGSGNAVGAYWTPTALQPSTQTRSHSRNAYYDPVKSRSNLILATGKRVNEILFTQTGLNSMLGSLGSYQATGVQYTSRKDGTTNKAYAKKEVILAAGAVFTPQLLQLSGMGPKAVLQAAGISVKKDIPGVGANLQDHPNAQLYFDLKNLSFPNPFSGLDPAYNATAWAQYQQNRTGPITQAHGSSLAFLPLTTFTNKVLSLVAGIKAGTALSALPSLYSDSGLLRGLLKQYDQISNLYSGNGASVGEIPMAPFGLAISALQRPLSRGTINIDPSNKYGSPIVQWNTFKNPVDRAIMAEMVRWTRKNWARPELAKFSPVEVVPGAQYQTDDEIINALIAQGALEASFAHMSGTCAMMPQLLGGVVASDLTVYGTTGLSVVDASIIPLIPATHLQATMYAVAEKAADIIKSRSTTSTVRSLWPFRW